MTARQLALPFGTEPDYAAVDFIPAASNAAARIWLARPAGWSFGRLVLCGPPGSGKTHLLHLWCAQTRAALWSGPALRGLPPLPDGPVALDDADLAEEIALFHLINAAGQASRPLLLAAREPPARWTTRVPDLASRLRASTIAVIGPAEDTLLAAVLARLLAERQLAVPLALQTWLLTRLPRHSAALAEAVARLDRASLDRVSLAQGRPITRTFATSVLAEMIPERPEDEIFLTPSPLARDFL